jgi:hypothetical protein
VAEWNPPEPLEGALAAVARRRTRMAIAG